MTKVPGPRGIKNVRAAFTDALNAMATVEIADPPPEEPRKLLIGNRTEEVMPGQWPGAPVDQLPPGCPVTPLGVLGHASFFVDALGQLLEFKTLGHDDLLKLFRMTPNALEFYWPKWSASRGGGRPKLSGVEVRKAAACLMKSAGSRGLFDPAGRVRGRGAWRDRQGRLIWHAGNKLWRMEGTKLKVSDTGEVDDIFYPRRPHTMAPWAEPVPVEDSPAREIFRLLLSWNWERGPLDAVFALGSIGAGFLSGALPWRAHTALMGERGTGKSFLQSLLKALLGSVLIDAANATEAGIRQHMELDALPVALDEFEASDDNRRVNAIVELARIASSGGRLLRGGQDHKGVEFLARSTFFCSGILLPAMKTQDKSRFAVLNLNKLQVGDSAPPVVQEEWGRMLLRALMDRWHDFERAFGDMKASLRGSGLDGRAQDTYGTLLAIAELMLGPDGMEAAGVPLDDAKRLGDQIATATAEERAWAADNWRECIDHILDKPINAWKGGEKQNIGEVVEQVEKGGTLLDHDRARLATAGVALQEVPDPNLPAGEKHWLLAVPVRSPALAELFTATKWADGGWAGALRQGRAAGVVLPEAKIVKINRRPAHCYMIDLRAYDQSWRS